MMNLIFSENPEVTWTTLRCSALTGDIKASQEGVKDLAEDERDEVNDKNLLRALWFW
jgi:hypothetical protein